MSVPHLWVIFRAFIREHLCQLGKSRAASLLCSIPPLWYTILLPLTCLTSAREKIENGELDIKYSVMKYAATPPPLNLGLSYIFHIIFFY